MHHWRKIFLLLPLAACTPDYPADRPGTWWPAEVGSNDANLKTMLVNPHDLVAGSGEDNSTGAGVVPGVSRLLAGQRTPLPATQGEFATGAEAPPGAAPAAGTGGGVGAAAQ